MELQNMENTTATTYAPTVATLESPADNQAPWSDPQDLYSLVPYPEDYWTRAEKRRCFTEDDSSVQVSWTDVDAENHTTVRRLGSWAEVRAYSGHSSRPTNGIRVISIAQKYSWHRLKVTSTVMQEIIRITGASSEILEYPLGFCQKNLGVEEAFSSAPLFKSNDHSIETAYVMKYAAFKAVEEDMDPWVIRQTAVYQKYDTETDQATWVFFHPTTDCLFRQRLQTLLQSPEQINTIKKQPLLIHNILFGTHFPLWRDHLAYYEQKELTIARRNMAQRVQDELRVNHETLVSIRHTENCCLALRPIFQSLTQIFKVLHQVNDALLEKSVTGESEATPMKQLLNNYLNMVDAYTQNAWFLQSRIARLANSITDTLSFKDSDTAKSQSQYMLDLTLSTVDDSTTVRVITIVTLIYLPATFMATLLGMNSFFEMDGNRNLVVSRQFWIYVACSVPLTAATLLYWWARKDKRLGGKEAKNIDSKEALMV